MNPKWWILVALLGSGVTERALASNLTTEELSVATTDGFSVHVVKRTGRDTSRVPVLLVHGTCAYSAIWDLPGRSVMDYLAIRGHAVYALDLRGMGDSYRPADYWTIDLLDRVKDVSAVAAHIVDSTGRQPVVTGWSQGGVLAGLVTAWRPDLVAGVGLFSVGQGAFYLPPEFLPLLQGVIASGVDRYLPSPEVLYASLFGVDPLTGKPTISDQAFNLYLGAAEPDSVRVMLENYSSEYFAVAISPVWPMIHAPALVVDGALDVAVGEVRARALFEAIGSTDKQLFILPRNAHGWFLEDNSEANLRVFDRFLSQFR